MKTKESRNIRSAVQSLNKQTKQKTTYNSPNEKYKTINNSPKIIHLKKSFSKTAKDFNPVYKFQNNIIASPIPNKDFLGFFNKKFDLLKYKKIKDLLREKSKIPEKIYNPHILKGNGIPNDIVDRINFLGKKFYDEKFQDYYNKRPDKNEEFFRFEKVFDYIFNYSKNHNELESIMMFFYFICKEIKFDNICYIQNEITKYNQRPDNVFDKGFGTSLGFTNIFEMFLKKLEIKYKHIDGYCKLLPKKLINDKNKEINNKLLRRIKSANYINENNNNNIYNEEKINHCWVAIFIKGEWYFFDPTLGSGTVEFEDKNKNQKLKKINTNLRNSTENIHFYAQNDIDTNSDDEPPDTFNFFYFMTPPELLISTHRPLDDNWQLLNKIISFEQFYYKRLINYGDFYKNAYKYEVKLLTHKNPFILLTVNDKLQIKLIIENYVIEADLYYINKKNKLNEIKIINDKSKNLYILEPEFPGKGDYIIKLRARSIKSTDLIYSPLFNYIIKILPFFCFDKYNKYNIEQNLNTKEEEKQEKLLPKLIHSKSNINGNLTPKIVSDYSKVFPPKSVKKICYDNIDFILIDPKSSYLRKGANVFFRIRIKKVFGVALLDGNKLTNFKRIEGGVYVLKKDIETNNVSICCLKGRNLYTEIFRFRVSKDRSLSTKKMISIKKK